MSGARSRRCHSQRVGSLVLLLFFLSLQVRRNMSWTNDDSTQLTFEDRFSAHETISIYNRCIAKKEVRLGVGGDGADDVAD